MIRKSEFVAKTQFPFRCFRTKFTWSKMFEVSGRNLPGARCSRFQDAINLEHDVRGFMTQFIWSEMFEVYAVNINFK